MDRRMLPLLLVGLGTSVAWAGCGGSTPSTTPSEGGVADATPDKMTVDTGGDSKGLDATSGGKDTGADTHSNPDAKVDTGTDACVVGQMAVCGRGMDGIGCALTNGTTAFTGGSTWSASFSDAAGWNSSASYYSTIQYPDINGDGLADICGRGVPGIQCGLSTGTTFGTLSTWCTDPSDGNGWNTLGPAYYSTIQFPDVNGDGKADMCERATGGIQCALSDGTTFGAISVWQADFSDAGKWNTSPSYYSTIQFPDINGDGMADVCGRGVDGIMCALSTGTSFGSLTLWNADPSDVDGWNTSGPAYYGTITFPDINGDGKADFCERAAMGIQCGISNGTSAFSAVTVWQADFSDAGAWNTSASYYATIQFPDINGDGKADVCGRGVSGMQCAISNGSTGFGTLTTWNTDPSDADGWNTSGPAYYATIQFPDINRDGKADMCERAGMGIQCGISNGTSAFSTVSVWQASFDDSDGWATSPAYWGTIDYPVIMNGTCSPAILPTPLLRSIQRFGP
jgi:uncharacterized protein (DUF2141 family)